MGLKQTQFFANASYEGEDIQIIICKLCSLHLCLSSLILSDNFYGSSGPAYLVEQLINIVSEPKPVESEMKTGVYLIEYVKCSQCDTRIGWIYKKAYKLRETYKEGKFFIEQSYIKSIPNNSSTASLLENVKRSRRRSSGAHSDSPLTPDHKANLFHFQKPTEIVIDTKF